MKTAVREKPIIFSGPMVKAILEGRKTQTRRVIKPQFGKTWGQGVRHGDLDYSVHVDIMQPDRSWKWIRCPYGAPGDRLWVREGVRQLGHEIPSKNGQYRWPKFDDEEKARRWFDNCCYYTADDHGQYEDEPQGTLNKLFMPRWASRITLEITKVRVERVQEISSSDCIAEGLLATMRNETPAKERFANLWDSINGNRPGCSWTDNPFVWAIEFRRLEAP